MPGVLTPHLIHYARAIRDARRANPASSEPALAPHFQRFMSDALALLVPGAGLNISPEYENPGVGRPDIALIRPGQPPRAFLELKAPDKRADPTRWREAHDKRQYKRFGSLPIWATSNFADLCLLQRDEAVDEVRLVPTRALDPNTPDAAADRLITTVDTGPLERVLNALAQASPPPAANAEQLAANLAHASKLVKAIITDRLDELRAAGTADSALQATRADFRDVLFAHPEAGGYAGGHSDELFASAFAQTLAFGLLLVREATGEQVETNAWSHMPEQHPLMRAALRVLSQEEIVADAGLGFTVMLDTVNSFDRAILAREENGRDPILHFYEEFLATFDPRARERYGVYYTPIEVVRYMVSALDRALRDDLGTQGLRDPDITILDPATGTGTFLIAVAERIRAEIADSEGEGAAELAMNALAQRMFGFELLIGPYAVAHYRLHHAMREGGRDDAPSLPRLGLYLADTLSRPNVEQDIAVRSGFIGQPLREERREADRVKSRQPILAIIGNPPYRRLEEGENETLVGRWMDGLWDDLKAPVREAGWGNQLNTFPELSVAFWRWAMWKMFEAEGAPGRGVVAYITNRTFLAGKPYAGLRKMLRERFDRIEIIDLRGDKRKEKRAGVIGDEGVFDIRVGTAITLAVANGSLARTAEEQGTPPALASIRYTDSWERELFGRDAKLAWLHEGAEAGTRPGTIEVERALLDDLRPEPFQVGLWPSLRSCFLYASSGIETTRDDLAYDVSAQRLRSKIERFHQAENEEARGMYSSSRKESFTTARSRPFSSAKVLRVGYRPLERRSLFNEVGYVDWPRPKLQAAWGSNNIGLFGMAFGTGAGPGVWSHADIPDRHAFSQRGGYAFPLYDRRHGPQALNLAPTITPTLAVLYGTPVAAEDVLDAILALLSASSYTLRFAEDLEDVFPHVPFPAEGDLFARAAAVGREIRAVETFARPPAEPHRRARLATPPRAPLAGRDWAKLTLEDGAIALCEDGSGRLTGIAPEVWGFAVSGYRVLPRWLSARAGLPIDEALGREVRDLVDRLAELIDLFARADTVLADVLASGTLTRDQLGLVPDQVDAPAPNLEEEAVGD